MSMIDADDDNAGPPPTEVNLSRAKPNIEVEVVDDTPAQDRGRHRRSENAQPNIPDDDEISRYSGDVQKRIKRLRYEFHEERRAKESAQREKEEAVRYAQSLLGQARHLQNVVRGGEKLLVDQARGRVEAELVSARSAYKKAYEEGDTEALIKAQEKIAKLAVDTDKIQNYQPVNNEPPPPPPPASAAPPADPQFLEWKRNNSWFERDPEMTAAAMGYHQKLVTDGIDPRSKEYYDKIDARIRQKFPENFSEDEDGGRPAPSRNTGYVTAPAVRTSPSGNVPQRVRLTATQVSLAKRLGITPEQYAQQVLKEGLS